jgi:hypothetical protein
MTRNKLNKIPTVTDSPSNIASMPTEVLSVFTVLACDLRQEISTLISDIVLEPQPGAATPPGFRSLFDRGSHQANNAAASESTIENNRAYLRAVDK